jgi:hypothetical protein
VNTTHKRVVERRGETHKRREEGTKGGEDDLFYQRQAAENEV